MQNKIIRLSDEVINQIAAGEVIENPASIVKELIENSLDAGASRIQVEVEAGGQQLIRIEDDGCGMSPEDALLSLERHATSKIRQFDDLSALVTMGFRGEALASVASVSHLELKTATEGKGTRVVAAGGAVSTIEPCARNRGTTIEVRSLFFNVPARKKFQKSPTANTTQIIRTLEVIALAHPEVSFSLLTQGKRALDYPQALQDERVEQIVGAHEQKVEWERGDLKIWGFASATKALANRTGQYLFVNRRPIFSPLISRAVKEGFGMRVSEHLHPAFVLFLEIPPAEVDINVHPQKKEARFRDESTIYHAFREAVSSSFAPSVSFTEPFTFTPPPLDFSFAEEPQKRPESFTESKFAFLSDALFLGVFGNYLLLQKEKLVLVDLAAAHARVLFSSFTEERAGAQALMWPVEIELAHGEEKIAEELADLGIECRLVGRRTLAVDALPPFLDAAQFPQFLSSWKEGKKIGPATTQFCRKLKKNYTLEEGKALWRQVESQVNQDPLGSPIWKEIDEADFKRILNG